ncbi:MAG: Beta-Ala-Xaa dipeptidase [Firmicutes bacterium ADurb.Bin248]|nr:MAG: Beta-Ala-Xaa dipeptidase [Firmicutes bacterium ADurb.Bin248]HPK16161.1 Sapep family Mn(2+)-dependent dipeptidase [Clostridia bacterium]
MDQRVDRWIDEHGEQMVRGLQKCLSYRTVKDSAAAKPGAPFGPEIADCLEDALAQAQALGFETKNLDGYCGCVDFGEGEEQLGILCHLDVVPEGAGWKHPPYAAEIHDGMLYARGVMDDKGPAFAALYAMAAIKALDLPMKRRVRLILGCDEESGMECLAHYNKVEPAPDMAFSPDAEYPVVNSEKMIFRSEYKKEYPSAIRIRSGTVPNAVPGEAEAELSLSLNRILPIVEAFMERSEYACAAEAADGGCRIKVTGVAAHASMPEQGKNAFLALLQLLDKLPLEKQDAATVSALADVLRLDYYGQRFGLDMADASGRLTLNVGVVDWDETGLRRLTVDIRAPISADGNVIRRKLAEGFAPAGLAEIKASWSEGYYMPPESELVKSLLDVYAARSGKYLPPLAIGGGTYARHLKNAVAFGIERPGEPSPVHMANERMPVAHLVEDAKMIADAIIALAVEK